mmetsp:Transcript_22567/g.32992  ORF Transcript_22567/g.32992 Transcript_22567/m.32992 type:complete len:561 (-) Transcript_22567:147-1829(-)|eukprot:CAMPEP_0185030182 /NCGR_PEP_ID=MMETSP1103-20130426/16971_1 /TAXON_ID=36769 /ORGANISM="Paraphysomonas bandaiensis, Strain Caron Lab Isolate" /LENGTH=560 /DNA_ID=CAMNT_0027565195 /DNA_START=32 /DNA_END=1714 /DNA_ORIENTATION=+
MSAADNTTVPIDEATVAYLVDNQIISVNDAISVLSSQSSSSITPITREVPDGSRIYKRSIVFLLGAAVKHLNLGPLSVEECVGSSFVFHLPKASLSAETTSNIQQEMRQLIAKKLPIQPQTVPRLVAIKYFTELEASRTADLIKFSSDTHVSCHSLNLDGVSYLALSHGNIAPYTHSINPDHFELDFHMEPYPHFRLYHASYDYRQHQFTLMRPDEPKLMLAYTMQKKWASQLNFNTVTSINRAIGESRTTSMIQLSEALHDHQVVNIASRIGGTPGESMPATRPRLVLIAGPSSSGKTTFAKRLCVSLETLGVKPIVLSVDSYYKAWQEIDIRGMEYVDWEALGSLNLDLLNDHLISLLDGEEVLVPEYDMKTSMPLPMDHWVKTRLPPGGIIIMEGIHCLNPHLTPRVPKQDKFQIMISPLSAVALDDLHMISSTQVRMLRRMVRDYLFRGRSATATLKQWPGVVRGERINIFPNQNNADVVMNSALIYETHVLKVHAEPLLRSITPEHTEYAEARRLLGMLDRLVTMPANAVPPQSLLREFIGGSWFYDFGGWYKSA